MKSKESEYNSETCNECGKSVEFTSGRFINRVPDFNDYLTKKEMGKPFPHGEYICEKCDLKKNIR